LEAAAALVPAAVVAVPVAAVAVLEDRVVADEEAVEVVAFEAPDALELLLEPQPANSATAIVAHATAVAREGHSKIIASPHRS